MADLEQLVLSISADTRQMQRALAKLTGDTQKAAADVDAAFGAAPPKIDNVAKSLNKTRFETANLAAQFEDIAVQLQGGQNPFTIALQQGTQINQVLGRSGAGGVVSLLGTAFSSLLTPVSLATIGIIALGGYAIQYGAKAIGAIGDLDDKLKAHAELIKSLKDAYGEAGKGVDVAVKDSITVLKTLLGLSTTDLQKQFRNLTNSAVTSMTDFNQLGDAAGQSIETTSKKFAAFQGPIDDLRNGLRNGTPDVKAFRIAVSQIEQTTADEKTKKLAGELLAATDSAAKAEAAIIGTAKATRLLSAQMQEAIDQGESFAKSMKTLGSTVTPDLSDREKIMKNYNDALIKAGSTEERLAVARARDDQLSILSANDKKKAAEESVKEAESAAKRFQNALNSTARGTAKSLGATAGLEDGIGAITRLETEYRLTEQAQQAFGKVTDETRAKIKAQADAAGSAADALARAKVAANTDFTLKTALLSPQDLQIAQQLRGIYGNDIPAALQSTEAAGIRAADTLRTIGQLGQDVTRGVFTDFASQIRNGASAMDALRTAGVNALGKIADKLAQIAADNLWQSAFGGASGGGLLGLLGLGAKSATGGTGFSLTGTGGLYDQGGYTGNGGKYQPAGIVHKGEYVFDADSTKRLGVDTLENLRGYADGGFVGAPSLPRIPMAAANDNSSVSVSMPISIDARGADNAGLARVQQQLAQLKADLPMRVVAAVTDAKKKRLLT